MPNSYMLWMAAGMLWIMDASINISMEPFRAFVGDMLPADQRTAGFAMQSFFIGIGAVIASALPWIFTNVFGMDNTAPEGVIPQTVKWSYYLGAFAFLGAVMWTVFKTKEYPPDAAEQAATDFKTAPLNIRYSPRFYISIGAVFTALAIAVAAFVNIRQLEKELYVLGGILALFGLAKNLARS